MKTFGLVSALVAGVAGLTTGVTLAKKEQQPKYSASVSFEFGSPMAVNYSNSDDEGAIEHWIHCATCQQGVIRSNGVCSYCGKVIHEQPKQ